MRKTEADEFYPNRSFFERREFVGTLSQGDKSATDLHVVLQYSLIRDGEIIAKILGNTETFKKISSISQLSGPGLKLTSKDSEHSRISFNSDSVHLGMVTNKPFYGTDMSYRVADLRLWDLTMREAIGPREEEDRYLTFFLAGPRTLWATYETGEVSYTGEENVEVHKSKIDLNEQFPFEIETRPWYFYDTTPSEEQFDLKTKIQALSFKTKTPRSELSDENFLELAKSVADDLILLISFLSRRWVTWFRYELQTPDEIRSFVRNARECSSKGVEHGDSVLEFHQARNFIKTAFTELRKLREENIDLHMPLVYYVSANEAKYLEEKFSTSFLSLERIKDMYSLKEGLGKILNTSRFEKLSDSILDLIRRELSDDKSIEMISRKLPELNRPSLRAVLDALLHQYSVEWKDLYPSGSDFTLIRTRDTLFHSSCMIKIDHLSKEEDRLRAILERLLLSMLGSKDFSHAPVQHQKTWLQEIDHNDT